MADTQYTSLNFTYIDASVMPQVKAGVENQSMRSRPILRKMKENLLRAGGNPYIYPVAYGFATNNVRYAKRGQVVNLAPLTNMGPLQFTPSLLTATLPVWKEDQLLLIDNPGKIVDFIKTWTEILVDSVDTRIAMRLWDQSTTGTDPVECSSFKDAIGSTTNTFGGRSRSTYSWWQPKTVVATTDFPGADDPQQLEDRTKDAYIMKLLQSGFAKSNRLKGKPCTEIVVPQYHFDMIERILDPQKHGDAMDQQYASWGFQSAKYRTAAIIPDNDLQDAQVDSNGDRYSDGNDFDEDFNTIAASSAQDILDLNLDGRFCFLNLRDDFLRMWIHPAANWSFDPWIDMANQPGGKVKHMFVQHQLVSNCSSVHCYMTKIYSPVKYGR